MCIRDRPKTAALKVLKRELVKEYKEQSANGSGKSEKVTA